VAAPLFGGGVVPLRTVAELERLCSEQPSQDLSRVRGTVTLGQGLLPDNPLVFYLQDETGGISVSPRAGGRLRVSQRVEVVGRCSVYDEVELELNAVEVKDLGRSEPVTPRRMRVAEAASGRFAGQLVRVRGRVLTLSIGETRDRLSIAEGTDFIGVYIRRSMTQPPLLAQMAEPESEIEVDGILIQTSKGVYQVRMRDLNDLHLLRKSTLPLFKYLGLAVGGLGLLAALAGLWIWMLQRSIGKQTKQIRKLLEEAREASELKSQFLANVSHELRTPIHGILGLQSLLLETPLHPEQRQQLETANEATRSLRALLDDLLDLSRIEAGKMLLSPEPLCPARLVKQCVRQFAARAEEKGIGLRTFIDPALPKTVSVDGTRLGQVLTNLVSNAVKFTDQGEVCVSCQVVLLEPERVRLRLGVRDTGIGIAPDKLESIFQSFHQADGSISRRFGGSGLGLAIAAKLAEMMGSRIEVQSRLGAGSEFSLELGVPVLESAQESVAVEESGEALPVSLRILLAEDNLVNQMVARRLLEKDRHEVAIAETGREAVERYRASRFDLVLMDVQMPEMDGLEATRTIRALEAELGRTAPIVALSAHTMKQEANRCFEAGMDGFLGKPFHQAELRAILRRFAAPADPRLGCAASIEDDYAH
jgi:signal transduction histidine kinase/CheY-like chemotaxis protein